MIKTRKTQSGRTMHRQNCEQRVRQSFTNKFGDVIALFGRHGFEWSVGITRASNKCLMKVTSFPEGRAKALAYYKQMCKEIQ